MGFKFNPFTGSLDIVSSGGAATDITFDDSGTPFITAANVQEMGKELYDFNVSLSISDRQRANHTGTQTSSTISNFATTTRFTALTGLATYISDTAITATDAVLIGFGKTQGQINAINTELDSLTPTDNVIIGELAGAALDEASNNVGIGYNTLNDLTDGFDNTVVGSESGNALTTGESNILIGKDSGTSLTTEAGNVIIGGNTGSGITTLDQQVLIADGLGNIRVAIDNTGLVNLDAILLNDSGSVTTPSLAFDTDTNNGIYYNSADKWSLCSGGYDAVTVGKSVGAYANVNMGGGFTTSDSIPLFIQRTQAASTSVQIDNLNNTAGANSNITLIASTGANENKSNFLSYSGTMTLEALSGRACIRNFTGKGVSLVSNVAGTDIKFYCEGQAASDVQMTIKKNGINMNALPTSATGLSTGDLWNNSGVINIA